MDAAEAKLQKVLEGSKQFLVPHYQRPYSWDAQQWLSAEDWSVTYGPAAVDPDEEEEERGTGRVSI